MVTCNTRGDTRALPGFGEGNGGRGWGQALGMSLRYTHSLGEARFGNNQL